MQTKITIDHKTGEIKIEALGYQGTACLQATRQLEQSLGVVSDRKTKPEFESSARTQQIQKLT